MSDTGAPWLLPYPLPSDLVRDGAGDIQALAEATATGLSAAGSEGIGPNVVQTVKTDTFTLSSQTFTDVTGMGVTITPSSATSKILVIAYAPISNQTTQTGAFMRLVRGATALFVGDADGNRVQASYGYRVETNNELSAATLVFLDSPNVATATTYTLQLRSGSSSTVTLNRSGTDTNSNVFARTASSITAIEVSA